MICIYSISQFLVWPALIVVCLSICYKYLLIITDCQISDASCAEQLASNTDDSLYRCHSVCQPNKREYSSYIHLNTGLVRAWFGFLLVFS